MMADDIIKFLRSNKSNIIKNCETTTKNELPSNLNIHENQFPFHITIEKIHHLKISKLISFNSPIVVKVYIHSKENLSFQDISQLLQNEPNYSYPLTTNESHQEIVCNLTPSQHLLFYIERASIPLYANLNFSQMVSNHFDCPLFHMDSKSHSKEYFMTLNIFRITEPAIDDLKSLNLAQYYLEIQYLAFFDPNFILDNLKDISSSFDSDFSDSMLKYLNNLVDSFSNKKDKLKTIFPEENSRNKISSFFELLLWGSLYSPFSKESLLFLQRKANLQNKNHARQVGILFGKYIPKCHPHYSLYLDFFKQENLIMIADENLKIMIQEIIRSIELFDNQEKYFVPYFSQIIIYKPEIFLGFLPDFISKQPLDFSDFYHLGLTLFSDSVYKLIIQKSNDQSLQVLFLALFMYPNSGQLELDEDKISKLTKFTRNISNRIIIESKKEYWFLLKQEYVQSMKYLSNYAFEKKDITLMKTVLTDLCKVYLVVNRAFFISQQNYDNVFDQTLELTYNNCLSICKSEKIPFFCDSNSFPEMAMFVIIKLLYSLNPDAHYLFDWMKLEWLEHFSCQNSIYSFSKALVQLIQMRGTNCIDKYISRYYPMSENTFREKILKSIDLAFEFEEDGLRDQWEKLYTIIIDIYEVLMIYSTEENIDFNSFIHLFVDQISKEKLDLDVQKLLKDFSDKPDVEIQLD